MPLPFDTAEVEQVKFSAPGVAEFSLPKLMSVTPLEELEIIPWLSELDRPGTDRVVKLKTKIATLALKRLHKDQIYEQTLELPKALVDQLADFLLEERRGWVAPEDKDDDAEKKAQTGPDTKAKREKLSRKSTGESVPDGPASSAAKNSATNR